jgi:alpha-L-rhamnosidase
MPIFLRPIFILAILCAFLPDVASAAEKAPRDLRCEYLTDPLGIDVAVPRFSWKLEPIPGERGRMQVAYQVRVASSRELLAQNQADLWDSGRVTSTQSTLVSYGGEKLVSNQDCYWQVRVFDQNFEPSAWSQTARFSMGLLSEGDWTGPWIRHPGAPPVKHIWFRKNFTLEEVPSKAFIHISSIGYHELFINGERIGDGHLAPAATRLDKRALYLTHDISALLKAGKNTIAVWHGPGWGRYAFFKTQPALRAQLNAITQGGKTFSLATDTTWSCEVSSSENIGGIRYLDHGGESIDARNYIADWNAIDFDQSKWALAAVARVSPVLSAQMMEPTRIIETISPKTITKAGDAYKVDMGKNFTGWVTITLRGLAAGDTVTAVVADGDETVQDFGQKSVYISAGKKEEVFRNRFNYIAGRYITFTGLKQQPELTDVFGEVLSTDLARHGKFSSSSALFNQIYETDLWTWRANLVEGFTMDCPHRERLGYGEVAFACAWGIAFPNYDSAALYTKHVRDWSDVQEPDGWIHHTAPQINRHYGGPMWSSAGLNIAWEFYQNHGDKRILEITYPSSKRWLDFLDSKTKDGLLQNYATQWGKFLGDWAAPGQRKERGDSPEAQYFNNCVYAMNLMDFISIARLLDKPDEAAVYEERLKMLRPKIHERFYKPETQTYSGGTQVQLAFALLTGITPEALRPGVIASFDREMNTKPYLDMGSSGLPVLFKYLVEFAARSDSLFTHLSRTNEPSYGYFLARGETTWPEYWNVDVPSRIHTCYTGVSSWFTKSLAGIRPDPALPGFQSFLIHPVVGGGLDFAEGEMESPFGRISSRWELTKEGLSLAVSVPPNSRATISLPTLGTPAGSLVIREGESVIWENNQVAMSLPSGVEFSHRVGGDASDSRLAWVVGSGTYRFSVNLLAAMD